MRRDCAEKRARFVARDGRRERRASPGEFYRARSVPQKRRQAAALHKNPAVPAA